jgi:4-hydroxyphenylpyruvate dioxygenase
MPVARGYIAALEVSDAQALLLETVSKPGTVKVWPDGSRSFNKPFLNNSCMKRDADTLPEPKLAYVEIYTSMAKLLAYWHVEALGFNIEAYFDADTGSLGHSSYVLSGGSLRIVLTSVYPVNTGTLRSDIYGFIQQNTHGLKKIVVKVPNVKEHFLHAVQNGAVPVQPPITIEDEQGYIEEGSVRLFNESEIVYLDDASYSGVFRPGYFKYPGAGADATRSPFRSIDHIASEVRRNECMHWSNYLKAALGLSIVQRFTEGPDNNTGMELNVCQSESRNITMVVAEPSSDATNSKVLKNINTFGPGIHHLAFLCEDLVGTVKSLRSKNVGLVSFPGSYYDMLRRNDDFKTVDIDVLQENQILIDKEADGFLLQKFIKPVSDRPFFIYELVQRVNGYNGFALNNINTLKKAEELEIMKAAAATS